MTVVAKRPHGFVSWEQSATDPDVVYRAALTSLPSGASKVGVDTALVTFTANGVQFEPTNGSNKGGVNLGASWTTAANLALLKNGGHIAFDVDSTVWLTTNAYAPDMNYFFRASKVAGGIFSLVKQTSQSYVLFNDPPTGTTPGYARTKIGPEGKGEKTRVVLSFNNFGIDMYVDGFLVQRKAYYTSDITGVDFDNFYLGGDGVTYGGIWGSRISNFHVSKRPIMIPAHPKLGEVAILGHSFATKGGYPDDGNSRYSFYKSIGSPYALETGVADAGISCAIHRKVMERGFNMGGQVWNFAESGATASAMNTATTGQVALLVANRRNVNFVIIQHGINDVSDAGVITAGLQATYQTAIDAINTAYPNLTKIIITNIASPINYTPRSNATALAAVDTVNSSIYPALEAANAKVVIVDIFTRLNGHAIIAADWGTPGTDIHPSSTGNVKIGNLIGDVLCGFA